MEQKVNLARLKGVTILYSNDLHDLGKFVVTAFDARWAGTGSKARPTLYGLARIYGSILDCASKPFEDAIAAHGLPLGATVVGSRGSDTRAGLVRRNRRRS
jgi:hypothetical protein